MQDDHTRYRDDLSAYLLGALGDDEVAVFEAHLQDCARCQAEERWLRSAVEVLPSSVEQLETPPTLRKSLVKEVRGEARRPRRKWRLNARPALALASIALLLGALAGYLLTDNNEIQTQTIQAQATPGNTGIKAIVKRSGDKGTLKVENLDLPKSGRIYEVWLARGKKIEPSASLFSVHKDGSAELGIPESLDGVDAVMVTDEPAGGNPKPSTDPILIANL
jgi:hypothetical protein